MRDCGPTERRAVGAPRGGRGRGRHGPQGQYLLFQRSASGTFGSQPPLLAWSRDHARPITLVDSGMWVEGRESIQLRRFVRCLRKALLTRLFFPSATQRHAAVLTPTDIFGPFLSPWPGLSNLATCTL